MRPMMVVVGCNDPRNWHHIADAQATGLGLPLLSMGWGWVIDGQWTMDVAGGSEGRSFEPSSCLCSCDPTMRTYACPSHRNPTPLSRVLGYVAGFRVPRSHLSSSAAPMFRCWAVALSTQIYHAPCERSDSTARRCRHRRLMIWRVGHDLPGSMKIVEYIAPRDVAPDLSGEDEQGAFDESPH